MARSSATSKISIINSDNQVVGAIMGVGGFLGAGEKKVAVDIKALGLEVTDGKMNVTMAVRRPRTF